MTLNKPFNRFLVQFTKVFCLVLLVAALVGNMPYPAAAWSRQAETEPDPYMTEILDWSIIVSGPNYVLADVALEEYPHGRGERIYIGHVDSLGFVEISLFDDEDTPEETIDLMLRDFDAASDALDVLDAGFADGVHYALARFQLDQGPTGYFYIEVAEDIDGNVDLVQSIYTLDTDFLEQAEVASSEISMNGLAFLGAPVIELAPLIEADTELLASTPVPVPTPNQGTHTFETGSTELVVDDPIEFDFPLTSGDLEVMFLSSEHGYGVAGFIHQESELAESVLGSVFIGAPTGPEAPQELHLESSDGQAFAVYRIETQGEIRAMVITVSHLDNSLWRVEAMAVTETELAGELEGYQQGVSFDGEPFLGDVELATIESILNDE